MLLSQKLTVIFDYFMITIGSLIAAIGLGPFLVEADVVPGGVTGISMIINFLWDGLSVGTLIWILNLPLFIWGIYELGNSFGIRTFYGFSSNAIFIDLLRGELPIVGGFGFQKTETIQYMLHNDFFFFVLVGSILTGIGLGIIFKFKGTTAGTEIVCAILKKRTGISPGMSMLFVDFFVIFAATIVLFIQDSRTIPAVVLGFYALLSLYVTSILLDKVVYGFDYACNMMIFSKKNKEITDYIMQKLDRGVTAFYARGMYTNQDREVLMTVVSPSDARQLTPYIRKLDPNAFLTISNVHEVLGEGFRSREEVDIKFIKQMQKREAEDAAAKASLAAMRAERDAKTAEAEAVRARNFANAFGTEHQDPDAHAEATQAEANARQMRDAADKARLEAEQLEAAASSIENCISADDIPKVS